MKKVNNNTVTAILKKTPYAHSSDPALEGLSEEQIKGLFYRAITDDKNSVIAEINRIVVEGNEEFAKLDASFKRGVLTSLPHDEVKTQTFAEYGGLTLFYAPVPYYTLTEIPTLASEFSLVTNGKYLFLRLTAPEGVVPDNEFEITVGNRVDGSFFALASSHEDALNGVYYYDFCYKWTGEKSLVLSVKWNLDEEARTFIFLFLEDYLEEKDKRTFVLFAEDALGTNSSTSPVGKSFIGFAYAKSLPAVSSFVGARIREEPPVRKSVTLASIAWSNNSLTLSESAVTSSSYVLASPSPNSADNYALYGVKCVSQSSGSLTFTARETPAVDLTVNLLIGD